MVTTRGGSKLALEHKVAKLAGIASTEALHAHKAIVQKKKAARKAKASSGAVMRVIMHRRRPVMKRYALAPGMMRPKGMFRVGMTASGMRQMRPMYKHPKALRQKRFHAGRVAYLDARIAAGRAYGQSRALVIPRKYVYGRAMYTGSKKYYRKEINPTYSPAKRLVGLHFVKPHYSRIQLSKMMR